MKTLGSDSSVSSDEEVESPEPVTGDVIGDTAYSERFVLKILLKLANLDTLQDEALGKSFEDDLCTLWDMTAEKDVVFFLHKHGALNLIHFAFPAIESPRVMEILIGICANMCCYKEAVATLLRMPPFLTVLLEQVKGDDSLIIIQVLRLVNAGLYIADDDGLYIWMSIIKKVDYSTALYFILKNSSHKDLLVGALENLNTISSSFNKDKYRRDFYLNFVKAEALESLSAAFEEVAILQRDSSDTDEFERILVVSLQITLHLVGFDKSTEMYEHSKEDVLKIVTKVLSYYENKLVNQKEADSDLIDIIDATNTVAHILVLSRISEPEQYFSLSYSIWKTLKTVVKPEKNSSDFEDSSRTTDLRDFASKIKAPLSTLICSYIENCTNDDLLKVLDDLGSDYEEILSCITDEELRTNVTNRTENYRSRLKDNIDA